MLAVVLALAGVSWWFTEPLTDRGGPIQASPETSSAARVAAPKTPPSWPEGRLEGQPAKELLLDLLLAASARLERVEGYTATFRKQERIKGTLGPVQTLQAKVRHKPFAIYLKFINPQAGKEVVYAEGHHGNKVIAHGAGVSRFLIPRLAVAPDDPLALADSRHPVTEAGIAKLTARLIHFRRLDLVDPEAVTVLDRTADETGAPRLRSVHTHPYQGPERPFARVELLYDPENLFPVEIRSFDWPGPGHAGELPLAEHYRYESLDLDASLTAIDFDPANPSYAFKRY